MERRRSLERTQRVGTVAGLAQRKPGGRLECGRIPPAARLSSSAVDVVMGQHLGAILRPLVPERLDPLGRAEVEVGAAGPRNLPVGDVADEHMPDGVLRLARHRRAAVAAHELLALERVQLLLASQAEMPGDRSDRAQPEHLPDNRGSLEQRLLAPTRERRAARR